MVPSFNPLSSIVNDGDTVQGRDWILLMLATLNSKSHPQRIISRTTIKEPNKNISGNNNSVKGYNGKVGFKELLQKMSRNVSPSKLPNHSLATSTKKSPKRVRKNEWQNICLWNPVVCLRKRG